MCVSQGRHDCRGLEGHHFLRQVRVLLDCPRRCLVRDCCRPPEKPPRRDILWLTTWRQVYNYYCSAAAAQVTAAGVSNSVGQSSPASRTGNGGTQQTGSSGSTTGTGSGSSGSNGNSSGSGSNSTTSSGPSTPVIVGAVVGVVGGLALIGAAIFFIVRAVRKDRPGSLRIPDHDPSGDEPPVPLVPYGASGKAALHSEPLAAPFPPPSPSPSTLKASAVPARTDTASPLSAAHTTSAFTPPPPHSAELSAAGQPSLYPPMPNRPELHTPPPPSPSAASELYGAAANGQGAPANAPPELYGQGAVYPGQPQGHMSELQGQGTQFHNAVPGRPELAGQYGYPQQQQQAQGGYPQQQGGYHQQGYPSPQQQQQQGGYYHPGSTATPPPQQQGGYGQGSWQSGPVPELHEMDGGQRGVAR